MFLGTALAGASSLVLEGARSFRTGSLSLFNLMDTGLDDVINFSIHEIAPLVKQRRIPLVEITKACLARIEALDPLLNVFITVASESALAEAHRAESEVQQGQWRGPLHGVPVGLKDVVDTAGVRTTAGSALFKDRVPQENAPIVQQPREARAVLLGKLNMHELAFGPTTRKTSYFGRVCNPWAIEHISGGSSGGSAAAVAAGLT